MARFFKHSLLVNINFDRLFELDDQENGTADKEIRPKTTMTNGTGNGTFNGGGLDVKKEETNMYQQQHTGYGNENTNNNNDVNFQPTNNFGEDHFSQLIILALLFLHLLYKFRYLFPSTARMLEDFWKYLSTIEDSLSQNFLFDNYIHFLCNEIGEQKRRNEERVTSLRSELAQMERLNKQLVPSSNINSPTVSMIMTNDNINHHQQQQQQQRFVSPILNDYAHSNNNNNNNNGGNSGANYKKNSSMSSNSSLLGMSQATTPRSNTGSKNTAGLACLICHKVFRNSYKLNRHQYVHKDPSEKPLACTYENCSYRSISNNDLNRHRMIHTGEKPYLCNINGCEKRYSRPDKLRNHRNSIHFKEPSVAGVNGANRNSGVKGNTKSFICVASGCNFRSTNRNEFNNHTLTHNYRCEQFACDRQFDKADKLRRHLERDHGLVSCGSITSSVASLGLVTTANGNNNNCNGGGTNSIVSNNFNQMTTNNTTSSNSNNNNNMNSNHVINNNGQSRTINADYATAAAMAAIGSLSSNLAAAGAVAHHQQTATAADLASVISSRIAHNAQLATIGHTSGIGTVGGQANSTLSMLSVAAAAAGTEQMSVAQFDQLHHQLLASVAAAGGSNGGIVNNQTSVAAHCNGQNLDVLGLNGHHHQQQQQEQQQQSQQQQRLNQGLTSLWSNADYNTLKERL